MRQRTTPNKHHRALDMVLLWVSRMALFLMSEVPLSEKAKCSLVWPTETFVESEKPQSNMKPPLHKVTVTKSDSHRKKWWGTRLERVGEAGCCLFERPTADQNLSRPSARLTEH